MITRGKAHRLRQKIVQASASLPDDDALIAIELFDNWEVGKAYVVGDRFRYENELYRVAQDHTSQGDWIPNEVPALYVKIAAPGVIPVWVQPAGSHDAYNTGDRVHYPTAEDPIYESTIDNNVWSPEAYPQGWQLVEE